MRREFVVPFSYEGSLRKNLSAGDDRAERLTKHTTPPKSSTRFRAPPKHAGRG